MSFKITNAPISFQELINKILAKKLGIFIIVYLDNIPIYTDDDGDGQVLAIRWVLKQLRKFLLFIKLKKYKFHQDEVWFFGYIVSSKKIHLKGKKIEAVK